MSISANLRAPDTSIVGLCAQKGADPRLWDYTSNSSRTDAEERRAAWAIRACGRCPALEACRAAILAAPEDRKAIGIVGGMTPAERRRERARAAGVDPVRGVPEDEIRKWADLKVGRTWAQVAELVPGRAASSIAQIVGAWRRANEEEEAAA